jgi:tetratricopeptide (TPR) repeat protein
MGNKIVISLLLVALLGGGWYSTITGIAADREKYNEYVKEGDTEYENTLYQKSITAYEKALAVKSNAEVQRKLISAYDKYYSEDQSYERRQSYIDGLDTARGHFPKEVQYWVRETELYIESEDYDKAMSLFRKADAEGISSKELDTLGTALIYSNTSNLTYFSNPAQPVNDYFIVSTGNSWNWLSGDGEKDSSDSYIQISPINSKGVFLCTTEDDATQFVDMDDVVQGKTENSYSDFGVLSEDLISVKSTDGTYSFINLNGKEVCGGYQQAGSFNDGKAAVQNNEGKWGIINKKGEYVIKPEFDDIKLNLDGRYVVDGVVLAAQNSEYKIYNPELTKTRDGFSCDNIDIPTGKGWIAFCQSNKWGFVDAGGEVVIEPQYEEAKSFSNGLAAVSKDGSWGYINTGNNTVIDCTYYDAGYLSDSGGCMVSDRVDFYRMIVFNLPDKIKG